MAMQYKGVDHKFDWKGCVFFIKISALCAVLGVGAHYSFFYAESYLEPTQPPALTVVEESPLASAIATISTSTSKRIINKLSIAETVPKEGKLVAADLVNMKVQLYENGALYAEYPILSKGRVGSAWETPSGFYAVQTKEKTHFSSIGHVYMPWSMQFYGNYFIHGWTHYADGTPVAATFSGGCIKLATEDAEKVFAFAEVGTKVFVYDSKKEVVPAPLVLDALSLPPIGADAYLVADLDTGDVYAEKNAQERRSIASVTKLMTALVANETISFDRKISVPQGTLVNPPNPIDTEEKTFLAEDLVYPLLMQSSNGVADAIASYYGKGGFVAWMNTTAKALDMHRTTYADPSGISANNISTPDDLFRLARYLADKKSFVFKVTHLAEKTIADEDGTEYTIKNVNTPAQTADFLGGKAGHTTAAKDTMLSVVSFKSAGETRRVAVVVLGSQDQITDTTHLAEWVTNATQTSTFTASPACVECATPEYRRIEDI